MGALDQYLQHRAADPPNTFSARALDNRQFVKWLHSRGLSDGGDIRWQAVDDMLLRAYLKQLTVRYSDASVNRKTTFIRMFLNWINANIHPLDRSAVDVLFFRDRNNIPTKTLTWEQLKQLVFLPEYGRNAFWLRDCALLAVLASTGCLASEISALDVLDVVCSDRAVWFRSGRKSARLVPINEWAWEHWLLPYLEYRRTLPPVEALFLNHRFGRLSRAGVWLICRAYLNELGEGDASPLSIRFSVIRILITSGNTLSDVAQLMGVTLSSASRQARMV